MANAAPTNSDWVPVSRAAEIAGIPKRTLYAHIERRELAVREVEGIRHVQLEALHALAARRAAAANGPNALHGAPAAQGANGVQPPEVADARSRVELHRLTAEELRAADLVRDVREDVAAAEALRAAKRVREEIAADRERLELEQLAWRHEHERAEAEGAARWKAQQRHAQLERERAEASRAEARRRAETERRLWARQVEDDVARHATAELGPLAVGPAREAARRALEHRSPDDDWEATLDLINIELDVALADIEEAQLGAREQLAREKLVTDVMFRYVVHAPEADVPRIRAAAEREAAIVRPQASDAEQRVRDAAKAEHDAIERERYEQRQVEIERDRAKRQQLDEEAERAAWAGVYAKIPSTVASGLPSAATEEERAFAVRELQNLVASRPSELRVWHFEYMARDLLAPMAVRVKGRLRAD